VAIINEIERKKPKYRALDIALYTFLTIFAIVQFLPITWMALGTSKTNSELISAVPTIFPANWNADSYKEAFQRYSIGKNILNTLYICIAIIILQTFTSTLCAYALSKIKPKCGKFVYLTLLGTQMFSVTALLFPTYILFTKIGLIGTKWGWILSSGAWAYAIVLYKSFFDGIPDELIEAADIDGATTAQKILNIIIPLAKPVFAVNILNTFMAVYNDFLFPLMILPDEKDWTIMIRIFMMEKGGTTSLNVLYVLLFIACIPSILFYLIAQKQIQEGISTSGIKG
jgi:multiple sugar transport system permease protein